MAAKDPKVRNQSVDEIYAEILRGFLRWTGRHKMEGKKAEPWFEDGFKDSVQKALDAGLDWDEARPSVIHMLGLAGRIAAALSEDEIGNDNGESMAKRDVLNSLLNVREEICLTKYKNKGRWCSFLEPEAKKRRKERKKSKRKNGKKAKKK